MNNIKFVFDYPYLLLLLPIVIILALIPHLRLNKHRRRTRNRIVSLTLHIVIVSLMTLLLSGFKIRVEDSLRKDDIIFLIDVSDSNANIKNQIDDYLDKTLAKYDHDNRIGFVTFANESTMLHGSISKNVQTSYKNYLAYDHYTKTSGTNFEEALLYCKELLDGKGRIIILSDGKETDGNAFSVVKQLSNEGIQIDGIYFDSNLSTSEVQINEIVLPEEIKVNKNVTLGLELESNGTNLVTLQLFDNDVECYSRSVNVRSGINTFTIEHTFTEYGSHVVAARIIASKDTVEANNCYYSVFDIQQDNKILLIEGTSNEATKLTSLLSEDYEIDVTSPSMISSFSNQLENYGEIILMNVSNNDLPSSFASQLETYIRSGGGVLTTGGANTYYYGNMALSRFNEFLPISINREENKPIAIMLIMDISSSMNGTLPGSSKTKLELAKEGVIESINALRDCDYVSVIAFDANASLVVPMTPVSRKEEIFDKIESIKIGYGTAYVQALNLANQTLLSFTAADTKHIIFMSDGSPTDEGYIEKLSYIRTKGVTASTIGIGDDVNEEKLQDLAQTGGGNCYIIEQADELKEIMVRETKNVQAAYLNEVIFTPKIVSHTSAVSQISSVPSLKGYIGAEAKEDATVVLQYEQDPIYASWNCGSGKVGSFMSDLSGIWSENYFDDSRGITFIFNIVKDLFMDKSSRSEMSISFVQDNYSNLLQVRTSSNSGKNTVECEITYPDSSRVVRYDLQLISANTYSLAIPDFTVSGAYSIKVIKTSSRKVIEEMVYTSFSYSEEYDEFILQEQSYSYLLDLCEQSGGTLYSLEDDLFNNDLQLYDYEYDPRVILFSLSVILFLLDIAVRKFKFKWPHEWFSKKDNPLNGGVQE